MNKKNFLIALLFCFFVKGFAQGAPVIDITNILTAIENGYTMYSQLNSMIEQLKTTKEQLEAQKRAFEDLNIEDLDATDPLGSWSSIMSYGDDVMQTEENIGALLNNKNMKIGTMAFSMNDLYNTDFYEKAVNEAIDFNIVDPFDNKLTTEEKATFQSKYGMSYGHYMRYNAIASSVIEKSAEIQVRANDIEENYVEKMKQIDSVGQDGLSSDSTLAVSKSQLAISMKTAQAIEALAKSTVDIGTVLSGQFALEQENNTEEMKNALANKQTPSIRLKEANGNDDDFK